MNNFNFYSPTMFVFGKERENEAGKYVKRFGGYECIDPLRWRIGD